MNNNPNINLRDIQVVLFALWSGEKLRYTAADTDGEHAAELTMNLGMFQEKWDGKRMKMSEGYTGLQPIDLQDIADELKQQPSPTAGVSMFEYYRLQNAAGNALVEHQ